MRILKILFLVISLSMPLTSYACWDDDEDDWGTWDPWNEDDDDDGSYDNDSWTDAGWDGYGSDGGNDNGDDYDDVGDDYYGYGVVITPDDDDDDWWRQPDQDDDDSDDDNDWNDDYYDDDNTSSDNNITVKGQDKEKPSYDLKDTDFLIKKREELEELVKKCYKQINKNWCLSTTLEYVFLYYGLSVNEGDIVKYILEKDKNYFINGFEGDPSLIVSIIESLLECEKINLIDIPKALDDGFPVMTNVESDDCTHSVMIIGYNSNLQFICLDPLIGNFVTYEVNEFKFNYIIKIINVK